MSIHELFSKNAYDLNCNGLSTEGLTGIAVTGGNSAPYVLSTIVNPVGTNSGTLQVINETSAFANTLSSVLALSAPHSVTLGGGCNFIRCTNAAAGGAPYTNTAVFNVGSDGTCSALAFPTWSSIEYKKNIEKREFNSRDIKNISFIEYHYLSDKDDSKKRFGIIWEEINNICPVVCLDADNGKQVDLVGLVSFFGSLLKNAEKRITDLETEIANIKKG